MQVSSVRITMGGHEEKSGYEVMRMFPEFAYQSNCMSARNSVDLIVTACTRTRSCRKIDGMTGATERSYRACRITAPFDQTMLGIIHRIPECLGREGCEASVLEAFLFHFFFYLFYFFFDRWHFGGKGNINGRLEYSFKNDGIIEVCRKINRSLFCLKLLWRYKVRC
jgi:hypothetical protein